MSGPNLLLVRETLAAGAADDSTQPLHARAFAAWVQNETMENCPLLAELAKVCADIDGPARQSAHAAVLGYAAHMSGDFRAPFVVALEWLSARKYFVPGRALIFEVDGLALFGVAIGLVSVDAASSAQSRAWLMSVLERTLRETSSGGWNEALIRASSMMLSGDWGAGEIADDLRVALAAKGVAPATDAARTNAWTIISGLLHVSEMTRAAAQVAALTFLLRHAAAVRLGSPELADVARLLQGVARSMRRWPWESAPRTPRSAPARWDVESEYHVQDLLWAVLAPVFADLDDEEWLKSLGHHHPRADLAIPSLRLIIEVKFMRRGRTSDFSEIVQQVAADASTYLQEGSGFRDILVFVWDDSATTEQHAELRQGLLRIGGIREAIILPRPARMARTLAAPAGKEAT